MINGDHVYTFLVMYPSWRLSRQTLMLQPSLFALLMGPTKLTCKANVVSVIFTVLAGYSLWHGSP